METYGRRISDGPRNIIIPVNELCRLCLAKEKEMVPIYDDYDVPISLKIMACINLEVYAKDGLPNMICHACKDQLEKSYQFRKKCEAANTELRKHIKFIQKLIGQDNEDNQDTIDDSEGDASNSGQSHQVKLKLLPNLVSTKSKDNYAKTESIEISEENLVGGYIIYPNADNMESEENTQEMASNIALTASAEKAAETSCIIQTTIVKQEHEADAEGDEVQTTIVNVDSENDYAMEVTNTSKQTDLLKPQSIEESRIDANEESKLFNCDKCPKAFSEKIMLQIHQGVHLQERGFTCQDCDKWFPSRSALIRHERIHTGEKPFDCHICHRAFSQNEVLIRHLMTHTGKKLYQCHACDKSFSRNTDLRVHMSHHEKRNPINGNRLYQCEYCPRAYHYASGLSRHVVTHLGRKYTCGVCEKTFTDKSSLHRHSRIHPPKK